MGFGKKSHILYQIDFGLAKRYLDPKTGRHNELAYKGFNGTARYASLSAQMGMEQSRRDDLEAIAYMLCYFLRNGNLPWKGLKVKRKKEREELLVTKKQESTFEILLEGKP